MAARPTVVWRKMTYVELEAVLALRHVRCRIASFDKRFVRDIQYLADAPIPQITDKMADVVKRIVYRYRRQIPDQLRLSRQLEAA